LNWNELMARRNIFDNVMKAAETKSETESAVPSTVAKFGAAKSISSSIDELARQANMLILGENIVEVDPALIDASFVSDRMEDTSAEGQGSFHELLRAIRERGQDTPVLLRPTPERPGRFQIVFGHRRVRAARELMRPVRAVVKSLQDIDLVLAQGQENAARSNLSFIERVLFASRLEEMGYARDVIQSALAVDYQTLSKMLTIPKIIPAAIIDAIGPAKSVGRDRWLELRKLLERPGRAGAALSHCADEAFVMLASDDRFSSLFALAGEEPSTGKHASGSTGKIKKAITPAALGWQSPDKAISAKITRTGSTLTLALKSHKSETGKFGDYVSKRLEDLYSSFLVELKPASKDQSGD
jgi:ParB family transcriptional regulator, chromosome partitioning protein